MKVKVIKTGETGRVVLGDVENPKDKYLLVEVDRPKKTTSVREYKKDELIPLSDRKERK